MFTNEPTAGRAEPSKASKDKAIKAFARHERGVTKGEHDSLLAWWAMAEDAIALFGDGYGVASQYARLVHKAAQDNTETTIRQYVGAVITAMGTINKATGKKFKARDFKGIGHLRATVRSGKKGKAPEGSRVLLALTGPVSREIRVAVDGRAAVVDDFGQLAPGCDPNPARCD